MWFFELSIFLSHYILHIFEKSSMMNLLLYIHVINFIFFCLQRARIYWNYFTSTSFQIFWGNSHHNEIDFHTPTFRISSWSTVFSISFKIMQNKNWRWISVLRHSSCFKGAGGGSRYDPSWKLILWCFLKEESEIYRLLFTASKNIDPSQSYCWSKVSAYV